MSDVADFIHDCNHPYWELVKDNREFCLSLYLEVQAALGVATGTRLVAQEEEDQDRERRARNFINACRSALCSLKVIKTKHNLDQQREAQQKRLDRSQSHQQTVAQQIVSKKERIEAHNKQREKELNEWRKIAVSLAKELVSLGRGEVLSGYHIQGTSMTEMLDRIINVRHPVTTQDR